MNNTNIEYELKAWAPPKAKLEELLSEFKREGAEKFQEDVYFDTVDKTLYKFGAFIRIRNGKIVEIKFNPNNNDFSHLESDETRFDLPLTSSSIFALKDFLGKFVDFEYDAINQGDTESILQSLGLHKFVTISKRREIYSKPGVEFCIDSVENLGEFIEIESINQDLSKKYQEWISREGIKVIPVGYVELYLRKYDFSTYMTGRYLLDEDKRV